MPQHPSQPDPRSTPPDRATDKHTVNTASTWRVIGTAGHVDHGKSSLVKALTGVDPDTLPEEQERGMTIVLGFAALDLPEVQRRAGFVDVPGHERLVRTMVGGAGMLQGALFLVAADDGWMPQTEEHLEILCMLGVANLLVVITKVDLVDATRLDDLRRIITRRLATTPFATAGITTLSVHRPELVTAFRADLAAWVATLPAPIPDGPARLHVDRAFHLPGAGLVVTGTLLDGAIRVGDELFVLPHAEAVRVRGIEIHGQTADHAAPGCRVGLRIASTGKHEPARGDQLVGSRTVAWPQRADGIFDLLPHAGPLMPGSEIEVLIGTAAYRTRVRLLGGADHIARGGRAAVRLDFGQTLALKPFDRAIVRRPTPPQTLGRFTAVRLDPDDRPRHVMLADLEAIVAGGRPAWAANDVRRRHFADRTSFCARWPWTPETANRWFDESHDGFTRFGTNVLAATASIAAGEAALDQRWDELAIGESLDLTSWSHHDGRLPAEAVTAWQNRRLTADAELGRDRLFKKPPVATDSAAGALLVELEGDNPPTIKEIQARGAAARQNLDRVLQTGLAISLGAGLVLPADRFNGMRAKVLSHLKAHGQFRVTEIKPVLGLSRKYVVPFLEKLDEQGFTRRDGDLRKAGPKAT